MDSSSHSGAFADFEFDVEVFQDHTSRDSFSFTDLLPSPSLVQKEPARERTLSRQDTFEFSTVKTVESSAIAPFNNLVIFCGKDGSDKDTENEEFRKIVGTRRTKNQTNEKNKLTASPARNGNKTIRRYTLMRTSRNVLIGFGCNVTPTRIEVSDIKNRQMKKLTAGESPNRFSPERTRKDLVSFPKTIGFKSYLTTAFNKMTPSCFLIPAVSL